MQVLTEKTEQDRDGANAQVVKVETLRIKVRRPKTTTANCERTDVINLLLAGVNEKVGNGRNPATWKQINGQVRGLLLRELYALLKVCRNANSFGAMFWHLAKKRRLKAQKPVDKPLDTSGHGARMP